MDDLHRSGSGVTPAERIYFAWNDALSRNDPAALLACYATDAVLESPLIPHLLTSSAASCVAMPGCDRSSICSPSASRGSGNITAPAT